MLAGIGAPSSPVTVKVNLPVISAGVRAVVNLQILDTRKRCLGSIRGVGVLELDALDVLGVLQLVRGNQLALAVIG